jgi:uncharacterized membrane-anchored protein
MRPSIGICAFLAWALFGAAQAAEQPQLTPQQQAEIAKLRKIAQGLHPQYGDVKVGVAGATLHLAKDYYFIPADQARSVLVDAWGNPPEAAVGVQGIVFPAGKSFLSDSWAAVISYEDSGFVDDKDAKTTDYGAMLTQARDGDEENNAKRKKAGYAPLHLIGWAQPPYYDASHHTLVWARELSIDGAREHTLNYDLRALGRRGVLSMNIISGMSKLAEVRGAAGSLQNVGTFDAGNRYQDYKAGSDKLAEYGVGGLVAAGIGLLAAKKIGLIAIVLLFAKKFIAYILVAFTGFGAWLRRVFLGRKAQAATTAAPAPMLPPSDGPAP